MNKKTFSIIYLSISVIASSLILSGCNSDPQEIERPEKIYYDQAQRRMKAGNYFGAIDSLTAIESQYPFGKYSEQAQVELIYAYFMNSENEASHSSAERFIRLHPRHPNIDYAYFMKGLSSFTADKGFMVRIIGTDLSTRDISGAKDSFSELTEFLTRFPDSQYASYANQRIVYLRNLIASGELAAADYYVKRKAYVAAIRRANYVIENIPNSSENLRALNILSTSYLALGYTQLYEDTLSVIALNKSKFKTNDLKKEPSWSWKSIIGMNPGSSS